MHNILPLSGSTKRERKPPFPIITMWIFAYKYGFFRVMWLKHSTYNCCLEVNTMQADHLYLVVSRIIAQYINQERR